MFAGKAQQRRAVVDVIDEKNILAASDETL